MLESRIPFERLATVHDAARLGGGCVGCRAGAEHERARGPAEDGGYVLVGLRHDTPALFEGIAWGGPLVMAQTRAQLARLGMPAIELATLWDLDRPEDLARLRL